MDVCEEFANVESLKAAKMSKYGVRSQKSEKKNKKAAWVNSIHKKTKESKMIQNMFWVWQGKTYVSSAPVHHFISMAATLAYTQKPFAPQVVLLKTARQGRE